VALLTGLWPAIEEFLAEHSEWEIQQRFTNNNGLTILARVAAGQTKSQAKKEGLDWKHALSPDHLMNYAPPVMPSLDTAFGEKYRGILFETVQLELHDDSERAGHMYRCATALVHSCS
jgi:hypothetical protein